MADDLESLAARVEREQPSRDLWLSIWADHFDHEVVNGDRFYLLACAEAWRDAAAMLMPEGWRISQMVCGVDFCDVLFECTECDDEGVALEVDTIVHGPHAEARARLAAALRAHAASKEPGR